MCTHFLLQPTGKLCRIMYRHFSENNMKYPFIKSPKIDYELFNKPVAKNCDN